jgi:SAM-dependent methyltransferase
MRTISANLRQIEAYHPEMAAGGYPAGDHIVTFFTRTRSLLPADGTVVDFGAGRGRHVDELDGFRMRLRDLRGPERMVIGYDIDPVVLTNPLVDRALVGDPRSPLRDLEDNSVDLVFAWAVMEHLTDPPAVMEQVCRILKPGGWFCAWTPNKWGYPGIAARMIPNRLHTRVVTRLQPYRPHEDVFPTAYRMNSLCEISNLSVRLGLLNASHSVPGPSGYVSRPIWVAQLVEWLDRAAPRSMQSFLHIFLQKPFPGLRE